LVYPIIYRVSTILLVVQDFESERTTSFDMATACSEEQVPEVYNDHCQALDDLGELTFHLTVPGRMQT
jgi:hypothetical protein